MVIDVDKEDWSRSSSDKFKGPCYFITPVGTTRSQPHNCILEVLHMQPLNRNLIWHRPNSPPPGHISEPEFPFLENKTVLASSKALFQIVFSPNHGPVLDL